MEKEKQKKTSVNLPDKTFDENIYTFPKSEDIIINKSNLQIQLNKFKEAVKNSFSIFDLLSIVSLWAPVFTADFKSIQGHSPELIKGAYLTFAFLITVLILTTRIKGLSERKDVSIDPEKMAQKILEQCQKKK